ncbi:MAG: hypothetical protein V3T72_21945 [Thermoanaerobaculia bacterium]
MRSILKTALVLTVLFGASIASATPQLELPAPEPVPTNGLTIHQAGATAISATYVSPYATLDLDVWVNGDQIESNVRDSFEVLTELSVAFASARDADDLVPAEDAEVDRMLADPDAVARLAQLDTDLLWTFTQMAEEVSIALGGQVPIELINVTRSQPTILGMGYERVMWAINGPLEDHAGEVDPALFEKDGDKLLLGSVVVYPPGSNCPGACGPGCAWCIPVFGFHVCYSNLFCIFHDLYCGSTWRTFFDCDFFNCSF